MHDSTENSGVADKNLPSSTKIDPDSDVAGRVSEEDRQVGSKARVRRQPPRDTSQASAGRALGLLIGYLRNRLNRNQTDLVPPAFKSRVKGIIEGNATLSQDEQRDVLLHIRELLSDEKNLFLVKRDYEWLWPITHALKIDDIVNQYNANYTYSDHEFLRSLNVDSEQQIARNVEGLVGGFWYVIRASTNEEEKQGPGNYNVSLLGIKPNSHPRRLMKGSDETISITSIIPHFSMRSAYGNGDEQIFRGRICEIDNIIYFIGDKGRHDEVSFPKILTMGWARPATAASYGARMIPRTTNGVIMTVSTGNKTIAGPVVCIYIKTVDMIERIEELKNGKDPEWKLKTVTAYEERIAELKTCVTKHTRSGLIAALQKFNNEVNMEQVISTFDSKLSNGGYYAIDL